MISDQTAAKLRNIRSAGLSLLREKAQQRGWNWTRDRKVLKDIANGNIDQAAKKNRVAHSTVQNILKRYDEEARRILDERRRKAMHYEEV